jgi:hypothetical protein
MPGERVGADHAGRIAVPHGAWLDIDGQSGIVRSGSDNVLCAPTTTGANDQIF